MLRENLISANILRTCLVCSKRFTHRRLYTCSEACHKKLIDKLVKTFGKYKRVIDVTTGKAYKVSTREILENGIRQEELPKYPEWKDEI